MQPKDNQNLELNIKNKESIITSIRRGELKLCDLPIELQNDRDIVLVVVQYDIWAFKNLSKEFQNDRKVVLKAVKGCCTIIKYVSLEFQSDSEIFFEAIKLETPSFMGKTKDENFLSKSLEEMSNHLYLISSDDLDFLCTCKWNFSIIEKEVHSMNLYQRIFSDNAKWLRMARRLYRERINILMKRILEDEKSRKKRALIELEQVRKDKEYESYIILRKQIEQMPIHERWRQSVIEKCGNICQVCGGNKKLEVHHRDSFYSILKQNKITTVEKAFECKLLWNAENGEVLCKECHDKMESSKKRQSILINKGKEI